MSSKHRYAALLRALRVLVACAVGACGAGALAGCTGEPAGPPATRNGTVSSGTATTSSPSSSPPTTAPPSSTPPTSQAAVRIPTAARAHTKAGAEAFTRFFLEQAALAWTRPDPTLIPPLSDAGCLSCKDLQKTAAELVARQHRYLASPVTIKSVHVSGQVRGQTLVHVQMTQNKVDVVDSEGHVVLTDPYKKLTRDVALVWKGARWVLFDVA